MKQKSYAVIAAAGAGRRMGGVSKPNIMLLGKALFSHVLDAFCASMADEIVVVCSEDNIKSLQSLAENCKKPIKFILGGSERAISVFKGIEQCENGNIICVHDCARPFVTAEMINNAILAAENHGASCVCTPVTDTVKYKDPLTGRVYTPKRAHMFAVQTPQCFKKELYLKAIEGVGDSYVSYTDETSLLEECGVEVCYLPQADVNMKITALSDVPMAETIMKIRGQSND